MLFSATRTASQPNGFSAHQLHRIAKLVLSVLSISLPLGLEKYVVSDDERGVSNVIIILVDDLGYGDLSCFGAEDLRTPHIDRLIAGGMKLTNFYATCPVCSPTRAGLLSGRYQDLVGVPGVIRTHPENSWGYLHPGATLLVPAFKAAGYHTSIVGKWHLGLESPNRPTDRGFDVFQGFLGDMMDDYFTHRRHGINYMRNGTEEIDPQGHATDLFSDWACEVLRRRQEQGAPFFLYLAYNAPHSPIQPPADWLEKVKQRETGISEKRARLVALIEHLDDGVGRVLDCLDETGLTENTLVFFTSDNGGQLDLGANNGPLRDGKGSVYEGGLKVSAGVRWPRKIAAGSESPVMATTMDILPTALAAAGVAPGENPRLDGVSFLPTLLGQDQAPLREYWFFRRREGGNQFQGKTIEAVRWGDWKLLQNSPFSPLELYNLADDPREERDLSKEAPQIFNQLSAVMRRQIQRYGAVPWQPTERTEDDH